MKNKIFVTLIISLAFSNATAGTNAAATAGQAMQIVVAGANAIQTKVYITECGEQIYSSCALAAMYGAQTLLMISSAKQSGNTRSDSACTGAYCTGGAGGSLDSNIPGTTATNPNINGVLENMQDTVNGQMATLGNKGYSYDSATNSVKTPNGSIPLSSASTADGMKDAFGLTDADLARLDEIGKKAIKEASQKYGGEGFDIGGGGGRKKNSGDNFDMNKYLSGFMKNDLGAKGRGVAGLEKSYGSDKIGVSQDNIFDMVHRCYINCNEVKKSNLKP